MKTMLKILFIAFLATGCANQFDINPYGPDTYQITSNRPSKKKLEEKLIKEAVEFCKSTKTTMIPANIEKVRGVALGDSFEPPVNKDSVIFKCLNHKQIQALKNERLRAGGRAN